MQIRIKTMTKYEIIKAHSEFFRILNTNGIDPKEVQYIPLVDEYKAMKAKRHKTCYIVYYLSDKYGISERSVYKIVKRFSKKVVL